jgi:hypothetical protein
VILVTEFHSFETSHTTCSPFSCSLSSTFCLNDTWWGFILMTVDGNVSSLSHVFSLPTKKISEQPWSNGEHIRQSVVGSNTISSQTSGQVTTETWRCVDV